MRELVLLLAACGGGTSDPCLHAFAQRDALHLFNGDATAAESALALGMACEELRPDELACLGGANGADDLRGCPHAAELADAKRGLIVFRNGEAPAPSPDLAREMADAVCACHDAACLVRLGEREHQNLDVLFASGPSNDPAINADEQRLRGCTR